MRAIVLASSWAMGATYVAVAHSSGIVVHNAAANQREGQTIATNSTAVACAAILSMGLSGKDKDPASASQIQKLNAQIAAEQFK